ncbi:pyridoxamine 5'-phosphate oxidase family protein [Actinocorallia sp. A-T 12471]|uniref:pyridoxamine 5'-phosphate oxidase family protein n=1 Tax=Actinocorallia sp. A-T 12471 TaxID=3089813 RepID=UPI0029CFF851|nr:pyridoxamine 5'-phosphate oxidase family protein [Actinocorallia sp. A-T 12471]MDX6741246.1 pyridoxamine 5'-phosphate oxidase family protein [Actinocorallia sp. A-T 12471]
MATWNDVIETAPEFAADARALFDAHKHKTIATLRKDGGPRISGIELELAGGEAVFGMMPQSLKARDIRRDPRVAVHSGSADPDPENPTAWPGDAKISGRTVEVADRELARALFKAMGAPEEVWESPIFVLDIAEVVVTRVAPSAEYLDVLLWKDGHVTTFRAE